MRRLSVWLVMQQKEGCFSPAVADKSVRTVVDWNNPADRGATTVRTDLSAAGP